MKERFLFASNIFLFLLLALVCASFQSSLWFQMMGYFPGPSLWVSILVYISIHRKLVESLLVLILLSFIISPFTSMADGILLMSIFILGLSAKVFKQRIYWLSATYVMLICGSSVIAFHMIKWILGIYIEEKHFYWPYFSDWIIEAILTALLSPPLFKLLEYIDRMLNRETMDQAGKVV